MTKVNESNLNNVTCLKYYKIAIEGIHTFLEVRQYHTGRYLCLFSKIIRTQVFTTPHYETYGFKVIYNEHGQPRFIVSGTLTQKQAEDIWSQIYYRLNDADHTYHL